MTLWVWMVEEKILYRQKSRVRVYLYSTTLWKCLLSFGWSFCRMEHIPWTETRFARLTTHRHYLWWITAQLVRSSHVSAADIPLGCWSSTTSMPVWTTLNADVVLLTTRTWPLSASLSEVYTRSTSSRPHIRHKSLSFSSHKPFTECTMQCSATTHKKRLYW